MNELPKSFTDDNYNNLKLNQQNDNEDFFGYNLLNSLENIESKQDFSLENCFNHLTLNDFNIISNLGKGCYGKVLLAEKKDSNELFAIKFIEKELIDKSEKLHHILSERNVLCSTSCPFIINLFYAFQTPLSFCLCLEYIPGGDLFNYMQKFNFFSLTQIKFYISEISIALNYLHNKKIIYRDLKPENILINFDGHIKLTDFGLSRLMDSNQTQTFCGTPDFMAPEIIKGENYDISVDWWSLGILIYEMIYHKPPFYSENKNKIFQKILNDDIYFSGLYDEEITTLIEGLLQKDPKLRFGYKEIFNHSFLKEIDPEKVLLKFYEPPFLPKLNSNYLNNDNLNDNLIESDINNSFNYIKGFSFDYKNHIINC